MGCSGGSENLSEATPDAGGVVDPIDPDAVDPTVVSIETVYEVTSIAAGSEIEVSCRLLNADGLAMSDEGDVVTNIDYEPSSSFVFTGDTVFAATAGAVSVRCSAPTLELEDETAASFEIVAGPVATVTATLGSETMAAGESTDVACGAVDAYGNAVEVDAYTLQVSPSGAGILLAESSLAVELAGTYSVACQADGADTVEPATLEVTPGLAANLAISVTPEQTVYDIGDVVTFDALVTDQYGNEIDDASVSYSAISLARGTSALSTLSLSPTLRVSPMFVSSGAMIEGSEVELTEEGTVTVRATVQDPTLGDVALTQSASLTASEGGPAITCVSPSDGRSVEHEPGVALTFEGEVSDANGITSVTVNGRRASVQRDGSFSASINPRFGINFVEVVATDRTGDESWQICSFAVAGEWAQPGAYLTDAVALELSGDAIDDGDHDGSLDSLGDLIDAVVNSDGLPAAIDEALRADPVFEQDDCAVKVFGVCVAGYYVKYLPESDDEPGFEMGSVDASFSPTDDGLHVDLTVRDIGIRMRVAAWVIKKDWEIGITSWVQADSISVEADIAIGLENRPAVTGVHIGDVNVEDIGLGQVDGFLDDLDDMIEDAGIGEFSLGLVIDDFVDWVAGLALESLLEHELEGALDDLLAGIDITPPAATFEVPRLDGGDPIELSLSTEFSRASVSDEGMQLGLGTRISTGSSLLLYRFGAWGVPLVDSSGFRDPDTSSDPIAGTVNVGIMNQALFALWRGGYFNVELDPATFSDDVPDGVTTSLRLGMPPIVGLEEDDDGDPVARAMVGAARITVEYPGVLDEPTEIQVGGSATVPVSLSGTAYNGYSISIGSIVLDELYLAIPNSSDMSAADRQAIEVLATGMLEEALHEALADAIPALPIPTFTIPETLEDVPGLLEDYDIPVGAQIGLISPALEVINGEHIHAAGGFGVLPSSPPSILVNRPTVAIITGLR